MVDFKLTSLDDSRFPTHDLRLVRGVEHMAFKAPAGLIGPAAKVLKRVGGGLEWPHPKLLDWQNYTLQPLGLGLVDFAALTIAVVPDKRFFQSGQLLEHGQSLAGSVHLETWSQFLRRDYPDLAQDWQLALELTPIYPGSLRWMQRLVPYAQVLGVTVTIMAQGPTAFENAKEIYLPAAKEAIAASHEYAAEYFSGLQEILDLTVLPEPSKIPRAPSDPAQRPGGRAKPKRPTRYLR